MSDENLKKSEPRLRPVKDRRNNVHVLPLNSRRTPVGPERAPLSIETSRRVDFSSLEASLDARLGKIENELRDSIELLEHDVRRVLKSNKKAAVNEPALQKELEELSKRLESRIQKSLSDLSTQSRPKPAGEEKVRLEAIRNLVSQLVKVLSFDFYKGVIERLGNADMAEEVDPFGMDKNFVEKIRPVFDYLYYKYWRVTTTGIENIPNEGRALIVANHSGTLPYDGAMLKAAILNEHAKRKDARFLVEDFVYHMPFMGPLMYRIGGVRACQENAELLLRDGHLVVVFPEGVKGIGKYFKQRYKLQRFGRGGFIKLCMKTGSPLIPAGVVGAEEIHPIIIKSNILAKTIGLPYIPVTPTFPLLGLLGVIPFPTKWSIHFGKPISFESYGPEALEDDLLIHKLSEKVREDIQKIIMDLLKKRRSIWFG